MIQPGSRFKATVAILNDKGDYVDNTHERPAIKYILGDGILPPTVEKELIGHRAGDVVTVRLTPEQGFGLHDPQAVVDVPKEVIPEHYWRQGLILSILDSDKIPKIATVVEVKAETIKLDFNHPLSNKILNFQVTIISEEQ